MSTLEKDQSNKVFLSIVQGSIRQSVPEGTTDAEPRKWQVGDKSGVKWEIVHKSIIGYIKKIGFFDGEVEGRKFQNLVIEFDTTESGKVPVLSIGTGKRYATDIMKKLPNINLEEEVRMRPYSFLPPNATKEVTGVEIMQRNGKGDFEKKIENFFEKKDEQGKWHTKENFPKADWSTMTDDDKVIHFAQQKKYLVQYTKDTICSKFDSFTPIVKVEYPENTLDSSPF